eukprot:scaffold1803_cov92-Amphora_coffeaeformis.AAC.53
MHPRIESHDELTIHTIHDTPVSRNDTGKVLDSVRAFNRRRQESAKGGNQRGKERQENGVDLNRDITLPRQFEMMMRLFEIPTYTGRQNHGTIGLSPFFANLDHVPHEFD